ncbi:pleckstrin homology domain-containing family M member 2 isoform X2 [Amia ocellicauda]|uniref:pleckstrin homology domain-containing family M member 2 isoform X2 n=1 Tax=Amia ocellicauda TaxID=2972642 RepID=UPI0034649F34
MDQLKVKDRILENISLSVKKLQSYFAACEDETPAIRNHDRVLQRLCEHLDHALLYGLQDISSGYWVLVLHFTRREAVRQIEELQHIATNLGRSRAWLYLALSESSLESYLRLFQENQGLLHKYYFKNALVCSDDHLALFLTLVSGLEFIRFDLELDAPYLDVAPYMPDYYKPQNLLDFEERLPSSDSLSLHSFTSLTSTNLEWDDSAIAPSSEEGDLTESISAPHSVSCDPPSNRAAPRSPTLRVNPFNEDSDTNPSTDATPVHCPPRRSQGEGDDTESTGTELEVIRLARRRKVGKKKRGKGGSVSSSDRPSAPEREVAEGTEGPPLKMDVMDSERRMAGGGERRLEGQGVENDEEEEQEEEEEEEGGECGEGLLRLPKMTDTSMDSVGQPLRDVIDQLDCQGWGAGAGRGRGRGSAASGQPRTSEPPQPPPPQQQPFRNEAGGKPPDPAPSPLSCSLAQDSHYLHAPPPSDFYRFTAESAGPVTPGGGHYDPAGPGQPAHVCSGYEGEGEREAAPGTTPQPLDTRGQGEEEEEEEEGQKTPVQNGSALPPGMSPEEEEEEDEERLPPTSPSETSHQSEFRVDNNHLLLLMIHVFRENEEQLFKMVKMSTGHMEGNLQPLYLLLTDCYIYLLRKGAAEKPYTVEEAVSYNELDYISVGMDQQTVMLVCTNRRRQFLLDTADHSLTEWFLCALQSAMVKGCREPPYPSVLTDATMERLALTKFVAQESHCEVSEVCIQLYSLVHWEDPMDVSLGPQAGLYGSPDTSVTKEGPLMYRVGTSYLGKELWKSCYLVLSNGILYQYPERTDVIPLLSINMGGEQCGGCRRANTIERPHSFQVILSERPPLELSANSEQDMADWMQYLCQSVSKGVVPPGVAPAPCLACCLVLTDKWLFTCHQDCQTSFFRELGGAELAHIRGVRLEGQREYCIIEFVEDRRQFLPPWVLYFSCCGERDRLLQALEEAWRHIYQVSLPRLPLQDTSVQKKCGDALSLLKSVWQRSDSLHRGRAQREPWC